MTAVGGGMAPWAAGMAAVIEPFSTEVRELMICGHAHDGDAVEEGRKGEEGGEEDPIADAPAPPCGLLGGLLNGGPTRRSASVHGSRQPSSRSAARAANSRKR